MDKGDQKSRDQSGQNFKRRADDSPSQFGSLPTININKISHIQLALMLQLLQRQRQHFLHRILPQKLAKLNLTIFQTISTKNRPQNRATADNSHPK